MTSYITNAASKSVRWKVEEIQRTEDVISHFSDQYAIPSLDLKLEFKFRLVLKLRKRYFEVYIESFLDQDVVMTLGVKVESNRNRKHVNSTFNILGPEDGAPQYTPLMREEIGLFFPNENVTLPAANIEMSVIGTLPRSSIYPKPTFPNHLHNKSVAPSNTLKSDMGKAFLNETGADLTINCVYEVEDEGGNSQQTATTAFKVQRGILRSRSPVFAAMFAHEFTEVETASVEINDMSPDALRELLRFLYTDKVENANVYAKELLMAANKYDIPGLKLLAEEALCENINYETILDVAKFAHKHNGNEAKDFAINCIVLHFSAIIKRPEWDEFVRDNLPLLVDIHRKLGAKLDSNEKPKFHNKPGGGECDVWIPPN